MGTATAPASAGAVANTCSTRLWSSPFAEAGITEAGDHDLTTADLRREANKYRERYGDVEELTPLERLDRSLAARRARLIQLDEMAAEIAAEKTALEAEISGIDRAVEALIREVLPAIGERFGEGWSPAPVLGYRLWAWNDGEMHGVRARWAVPRMTAECDTARDRFEVPHSDGRCGRLGCGVYAAKDLRRLLDEFAPALRSSFAAGLVEMTGKVVEHDRGYRAARAEVVALVAVSTMAAELTDDTARIAEIFDGAGLDEQPARYSHRDDLFEAIVVYLSQQERKRSQWI